MADARFASDNAAGVHPDVLAALAEANHGAALAYGADVWTERAVAAVRRAVGRPDALVWPVWGGTGANVLALRVATNRIDSVLCADTAHLVQAECGAPELVAGTPMVTVPTELGRVTPEAVRAALPSRDGDHRPRPRILSVANVTECGTVYTPDQLRALADVAHDHGMLLHVDGARLLNAAAALDLPVRAITGDVGVDLLSLGGTKNGLLGAEAVVALTPEAAHQGGRHRKQITQLSSKMRFVSAQLVAMLEGDGLAWAAHANRAAAGLAARLEARGLSTTFPVEANLVFLALDTATIDALHARWAFEAWSGDDPRLVRWACAFDTEDAHVDALLSDLDAARG